MDGADCHLSRVKNLAYFCESMGGTFSSGVFLSGGRFEDDFLICFIRRKRMVNEDLQVNR